LPRDANRMLVEVAILASKNGDMIFITTTKYHKNMVIWYHYDNFHHEKLVCSVTLRNHHEDLSESKPIKEQKWHIQPTEALYQVPGKCRTSPAHGHKQDLEQRRRWYRRSNHGQHGNVAKRYLNTCNICVRLSVCVYCYL
jgi:hypothetical protein